MLHITYLFSCHVFVLWAKDILRRLGVFAYNLPVMMRQKKNKFKRSEYRTFIDRFISVLAKINGSGHQMELKS